MKLSRHPGSPPSPADEIDVVATRPGDRRLSLLFTVRGDIGRIRIPTAATPDRKDGLWRHSCFEAFIREPQRKDYLELNLSPSGDWAAYRFDDYRTGMAPLAIPAPTIQCQAIEKELGMAADIDLASVAEPGVCEIWQLGLSAVIEADDGSLSHWALVHSRGAADFHHPDCFVLELPPASEP
ncbi:MAG TPA: DOMON-like domain-containing protein [Allosphingosinicella sp.]|nr:DOMON-like domain-containing protein [Allosphingosinicella sp.]